MMTKLTEFCIDYFWYIWHLVFTDWIVRLVGSVWKISNGSGRSILKSQAVRSSAILAVKTGPGEMFDIRQDSSRCDRFANGHDISLERDEIKRFIESIVHAVRLKISLEPFSMDTSTRRVFHGNSSVTEKYLTSNLSNIIGQQFVDETPDCVYVSMKMDLNVNMKLKKIKRCTNKVPINKFNNYNTENYLESKLFIKIRKDTKNSNVKQKITINEEVKKIPIDEVKKNNNQHKSSNIQLIDLSISTSIPPPNVVDLQKPPPPLLPYLTELSIANSPFYLIDISLIPPPNIVDISLPPPIQNHIMYLHPVFLNLPPSL